MCLKTSVLMMLMLLMVLSVGAAPFDKYKPPAGFDVYDYLEAKHGLGSEDIASINAVARQQRESGKRMEEELRAAFVFVGPLNDLGWSFAHNQGRVEMEKHFGGAVRTEAYASIPDTFAEAMDLFSSLLATGRFQMIVGTSFGYQWPMVELAGAFPDVFFLHVSGFLPGPPNWNLGFGKVYQARYLSGLVAGGMVEAGGHIGTILAIRIPEVYRGANAMYKGIIDANPTARLTATWTEKWVDHDLEHYHAELHLDDYGVEIITQDTDTFEPQFLANQRDKLSIGYNVDAGEHVSLTVLASAIWEWSNMYERFVNKIFNETWTEFEDYWGGLEDGVALLSPFSPLVTQDVRDLVEQQRNLILSGDWDVFCGEWIAPWWTGESPPTADDCLTDLDLLAFHTFLHPDIVDRGLIEIPVEEIEISSGMKAAMQALAGIVLGLIFICAILVLVWNRKNAIRYSSVPFLLTSLFGCLILVVTVFLLSPRPTDELCSAVVWTSSIGFTIFLVSLLAKTYRVMRIFRDAKNFVGAVISNMELFIWLSIALLVDIVLLICFQEIDSPQAVKVFDDEDLDPYEFRWKCRYEDANATLLFIILGWKAALLLAGCILTFLVRSVSRTFNESKHLSLAIYDCTFVFGILIPLIVVLDDVEAEYLLSCLGIIFGTACAFLILLLPKFWVIIRGKDDELSPANTRLSGRSRGTNLGTEDGA